jgi:hypothetical protein
MNSLFRNALDPSLLWIPLALLPLAVLALYFLKLKRQPIEVPSTYLWQKSIEDLHVNSLWQRLRQSLLLFLQLLLLALAMLALLQPGWQGDQLEGQRVVFLIDNSASMGATDAVAAENRLAEAKRHVEGMVGQIKKPMSAMLVSFNDQARVVQEFTSNPGDLREALSKITLTNRTTNLLDALQLADGLANPAEVKEEDSGVAMDIPVEPGEDSKYSLYIFSDGRFDNVKDFALGNLEPKFIPLGAAESTNLAISAFSTRRNESRPELRQAFVQVSNFSEVERKVEVELLHDGRFLDAQEITIPPDDTRGATFSLAGANVGKLTARLSAESVKAAGDILPIDNVAYASLNDTSSGRVLVVTPGNNVLTTAMATDRLKRLGLIEIVEPTFLYTKDYQTLSESGAYDLVVFDQCVPPEVDGQPPRMPRANTLFIGRVPPTERWQAAAVAPAVEGEQEGGAEPAAPATPTAAKPVTVTQPQVIDWDREHPLLAHAELGNFTIQSSRIVPPPAGGRVLVESTDGPIISIAPREGFEDAVIGFEIILTEQGKQLLNTNWYNRLSFPTFILNTLEYFVANDEDGVARAQLPGQPMEFRGRTLAKQLEFTSPDGTKTKVDRNEQGSYLYYNTERPGNYEVRDGEEVIGRFAVNLFHPQESDIRLKVHADDDPNDNIEPAATLTIGHVTVEGSATSRARKNYWRPVLLVAVGLLLFEWYVYNRRVYL